MVEQGDAGPVLKDLEPGRHHRRPCSCQRSEHSARTRRIVDHQRRARRALRKPRHVEIPDRRTLCLRPRLFHRLLRDLGRHALAAYPAGGPDQCHLRHRPRRRAAGRGRPSRPGPGAELIGFIAVLLASINVFGGFLVTHRMLSMFKKKRSKERDQSMQHFSQLTSARPWPIWSRPSSSFSPSRA